jgi:hypothetical protein
MPELYNSAAGQGDHDHWSKRCAAEVLKDHPLVTNAASGLVTALLKEGLSERALTSGEIAVLAKQLINDMALATPSPKTESELPQ